jgi:hypothetical protein
MSLLALQQRIGELGGEDAYPVVPLDLFFKGNDDPASIGPNLEPHPGVLTFERVLREIQNRPEVADVVLQVSEVMGEDEWPFVNAAYVITTASGKDLHEWAAPLEPDEYFGDEPTGWPDERPPPGAPAVPAGYAVVTLFWD